MSTTIALVSALNAAVVQNDTKKTAAIEAGTIKAMELGDIESKREQWDTAHRTSNHQLYAVLADCLAYGCELSSAESKQRTKDLEEFFTLRGYTVKTDSLLITRIVKAIFGNVDRRRISTYSLVLRSAQKLTVKPSELAIWIEQMGGIQKIKMSCSTTYMSARAKAAKAKSTLSSLPNLAIAKDKLAELADAEFTDSECVLLAEQKADGSFHIKALTRSSAAVNAALMALYGTQQKAST